MSRGIIFFGSPGSGTTTLGREVARRLGFQHFELDDYLYRWDTAIPYTAARPREERIALLMEDISKYPHFVLSGSMDSYNAPFVPLFDLAVLISAPAAIRAERVRARSLARWGERVLPGGDMYEALPDYGDYLTIARRYDTAEPPAFGRKNHEKWAAALPCPVMRIDGTGLVERNTEQIARYYLTYCE